MERLALDTRSWTTPDQAKQNFASVLIEQARKPLTERINYVELFINENGELTHPKFGDIKSAIVVETKIDELEKKAVEKLSEWANNNSEGQSIWISPPYPGQDESRFIVYEIKPESGKKKLELHAVCGYHQEKECLAIAEQILPFSEKTIDPIGSTDRLRETLIIFDPKPYPSWVDLLKETIGPPEVWEEIRKKGHIKKKKEILTKSGSIVDRNFADLMSARTDYEHLQIGSKMEAQASDIGYTIQEQGSCGISNTLALALKNTKLGGPFNMLHSELSTIEATFPCPRCKKPIMSGLGITKCPHCGITKEEAGSKCD
ncbi:MAG: hypothetical protein ACC618_01270 [Patescibacteria group bacterium]